jgi:hypothetical protein
MYGIPPLFPTEKKNTKNTQVLCVETRDIVISIRIGNVSGRRILVSGVHLNLNLNLNFLFKVQ